MEFNVIYELIMGDIGAYISPGSKIVVPELVFELIFHRPRIFTPMPKRANRSNDIHH